MKKSGFKRIERSMKKSWKKTQVLESGDAWRADVMREIRTIDIDAAGNTGELLTMTPFVWRFTAVAAVIALLFVFYAIRSDITTLGDLALMMLEDPASFIISPPSV